MRSLRPIRAVFAVLLSLSAAYAADPQVDRGKYLVTIGSCNDCHTPGYFLGKPDFEHALSGSEVGFGLPGLGTFVGRNLTPTRRPVSVVGPTTRSFRP